MSRLYFFHRNFIFENGTSRKDVPFLFLKSRFHFFCRVFVYNVTTLFFLSRLYFWNRHSLKRCPNFILLPRQVYWKYPYLFQFLYSITRRWDLKYSKQFDQMFSQQLYRIYISLTSIEKLFVAFGTASHEAFLEYRTVCDWSGSKSAFNKMLLLLTVAVPVLAVADTIETPAGWLTASELMCVELLPMFVIVVLKSAVPTPTFKASLSPVGTVATIFTWAFICP